MTLVAQTKEHSRRGAGRPAARVRHPLLAEFVHGFAPWVGAAVLLTVTVAMAGKSKEWQGGWAETREMLRTASALLGIPLVAAAGCWQGGRERRRRTEELMATAVRGPLARLLASALPVALWAVAGYAGAAALTLLATGPYATGDGPYVAPLLADAAALVSAALVGQVVGRVVAWRLAAPLLAAGAYIGLGVSSYDVRSGWANLSPFHEGSVDTVAVWWQPAAMAAWTGSLAVAAVLAYAARRRAVVLLPLAAASLAGTLLVQAGDGLWRPNPLTARQVCDTSTVPQICVSARYEKLLPQVKDALSGLTGRLEGVQNLPVRFEDRPGEPGPDEAQLPMLTPIGWSVVRGRLADPVQYAWEAGMALYGRNDCRKVDPKVAGTDDAVEHYLAPSPAEDDFDELFAQGDESMRAEQKARRQTRARLQEMDDDKRRAWLSAYFATARDCDPSEVPAL
jgi:hypothetical protein